VKNHEGHEDVEVHEDMVAIALLRALRGLRGLGLVIVVATVAASCGKKGPPLLPYVRQAAAADVTGALRVGDDVYLTISVPTANIDGSTPASVQHIEIWGVTAATPPSPTQVTALGAMVATIPIARYADPGDRSGTVVPDAKTGALQGQAVTVKDSLTADEMKERQRPASATSGREATRQAALSGRSAPQTVAAGQPPITPSGDPPVLHRYYMTIPVSDRKRPGVPSKLVDVPLTPVPDKVTFVGARMDGRRLVVEWDPSGGVFGFLLGRTLPGEQSPVDERPDPAAKAPATAASGPTLYNVYREPMTDPLALPVSPAASSPWASTPELPLNPQPQATLSFSEEVPFDERSRCYYVRAVRGTGAQRVESESSGRACATPVDTEPPAMVTNLLPTPEEGRIVLRWDPNGEEDLQGYIVLRSAAGDDTLQQLTTPPIAKTGFTDDTVMPGQTYTYVVHAVDSRIPVPNRSDPAETTATAR
jgi:hypothetical protein